MNTAATLQTITDAERRRRAQEKRPFAVAKERFTYSDSVIGPVTINRGEYVYDLNHEAIARRPEMFDLPAQSRGRSPASRPELNASAAVAGARDDALPRPSWVLGPAPGLVVAGSAELRSSTSPIKVHIGARARDDIARHAEAVPYGYETGGLLISRRGYDRENLELIDAWGPSPSAIRTRNTVALDWANDHSRARDLCRSTGENLIVGGVWHVHPRGPATPSEPDLAMFAAAMEHANARQAGGAGWFRCAP